MESAGSPSTESGQGADKPPELNDILDEMAKMELAFTINSNAGLDDRVKIAFK